MNLRADSQALKEKLVEIRRKIHRNPELSFEEYETGDLIEKILKEHDIEVTREVGKTGVVGILNKDKEGPVVALRGDIDALPIEEQNDIPFKSENPGKMHACGHDVHTTSLLGAAMLLSDKRDEIPGQVKFIFQPAEEINKGAKAMIEDKVLSNPDVDAIFGLHTKPDIPAGQVGVKAGPLMAAVDTIKMTIKGEGGHGAIPHHTRDSIVAASSIIQNLQTIVSRRISPFEAAVISFGTINGGTANNVISEEVKLTGTGRSFNPEVREQLPKLLKNIVNNTCAAHDTEAEVEYIFDLPAVINDSEMADYASKAVQKIAGKDGLVIPEPTGGGEDFAMYMQEVPGCFMFLGVRNEEKGIVHQWHHPKYNADEAALPIGAGTLAQSVVEYFNGNN
ncbi:MAG: M20 metallopeptidase family protein [Bacillota bacterium]